jgi:hypothetical protein
MRTAHDSGRARSSAAATTTPAVNGGLAARSAGGRSEMSIDVLSRYLVDALDEHAGVRPSSLLSNVWFAAPSWRGPD